MAKTVTKNVSIDTLIVNKSVNVRLKNNYDIPQMKQAILDVGRITDPIHARIIDNVILRGNRRGEAGQELLADPATPQEVAAGLRKVQVVFHDVQPGSSEEMDIILDTVAQKALNKTEILLIVWRLDKQFLSENQIIEKMYTALAIYTGNAKKAAEAQALTSIKERMVFLKKWLHGTVGNYMLAATKMGEYVREQTRLTHLADDRLLQPGEVVEMRVSRDRITQLSAARSKDEAKNGGKGWDAQNGGETFNALIETFKSEDRGESEGEEKKKRPSVKELTERADVFKSEGIKAALLTGAGDQEAARVLVDMDDRLYRMQMVTETLTKRVSEVTDPKVVALIKAIIGDGPAGEVELCINALVG